jgi:hypothetical protein
LNHSKISLQADNVNVTKSASFIFLLYNYKILIEEKDYQYYMQKYTDEKIRKTILLEYYKRSKGKSKNTQIHMYNFPELKELSNKDIFNNAKYLIDENLVRGGIDEEGENLFPWITRLTNAGIKLVEDNQYDR